MKKINYLLILVALLSGLSACKKDHIDDVKPVNFTIKLSLDADAATYGFGLDQSVVKITNITTNQTYTVAAKADGTAAFTSIAPGNYDVSATLTISAADFNAKAGTNVQDVVTYNATSTNKSVIADGTLALTLATGRIGDFVLKQIYYAGSNVTNGAIFRDQFIEIYNNSNQTLYADSLYIAQVMGNSSTVAATDLTKGFYQTNAQYDWTKSLNVTNVKDNDATANTNYIYAKTLFMIPGTGKQYPVLPGKSIIIAATAINHQASYTGADGKAISVKDPTLTVDLSAADFEVYLGNYPGISPLASDVDNPAVPNLTVISNNGNRDLIIDNLGRDGIAIFKTTADVTKWPKYATPDVTTVISTTNVYIRVPANVISDGIGLQQAVTASRVPKRMPDMVDAGENFVPGGSYSSQSLVRKTSKTVSGRIVLKDSNNSSNDLGYLSKADPSKSAASFVN